MRIYLLLLALSAGPICGQTPPQAIPGFGLNGATFVVNLLSPLSTRTANQGDTFTAVVEVPSQFQGGVVEGQITKLKRPKKGVGKGKAEVQFHFNTLTFNNQIAPIAANLVEAENSQGVKNIDEEGHTIGVTSNRKRAVATLLGAGIGAGIGAAAGGAQGAAIGAAAGGGAGLVIGLTMTATGSDVEFRPGSRFTLTVSDRRR